MFDLNLDDAPGQLFVLAALVPLIAGFLIALTAVLHGVLRVHRGKSSFGEHCYQLLGGDEPGYASGFVSTLAAGMALMFGMLGLFAYLDGVGRMELREAKALKETIVPTERALAVASPPRQPALRQALEDANRAFALGREDFQKSWNGRSPWIQIAPTSAADESQATTFSFGFKIDGLSAVLFVLVALISTLVHLYSMATLEDERKEEIDDDKVSVEHGKYQRRGRYARYFLQLSLLTFALLHLVIADNLVQVLVSWALVGVCSYWLIGFWFERPGVPEAATRTLLVHFAGDAALLAGAALLWTTLGTVSFDEMAARVRAPLEDRGGRVARGGQFLYAEPGPEPGQVKLNAPREPGSLLVLLPRDRTNLHIPGPPDTAVVGLGTGLAAMQPALDVLPVEATPGPRGFGVVSPWVLTLAGLLLLVGCLVKAAQGPFYTWLTDAEKAPLPVVALLQAVVTGVVGVCVLARVYPLLTPGVLVLMAYVGLFGLVVGTVTALLQDDLRRIVLASTVAQVGLLLIALGVGGWSAALFHLYTHTVIKVLFVLGIGCVLALTGGEASLSKLGGLNRKSPLVAASMLLGVLSLAGMPFFAGWYSQDAVLAQALGFVLLHPGHLLLFLVPLVCVGVTAFYLFRMWVLLFMDPPRDARVFFGDVRDPRAMARAFEPDDGPLLTSFPVVFLSLLAVCVAWGLPPWDPDASWLEARVRSGQPTSVAADFGLVPEIGEVWGGGAIKPPDASERLVARHWVWWAVVFALLATSAGLSLASHWYRPEPLTPETAQKLWDSVAPPVRRVPPRTAARPVQRPVQRPRLWDADEEDEVPLAADPPATDDATPVPGRVPTTPATPTTPTQTPAAQTPATSTPATPARPREPGAVEVALLAGLYLDELYRLLFVVPALWLGRQFAWLDDVLLAGFFQYLGRGVVGLARVERRADVALDRAVAGTGWTVWNFAGLLRRLQTGSLWAYLLVLALATVGLFVLFWSRTG